MASEVDVLMRLMGDSRGAVKAFDDTGQAAEQTTQKVSRLQQAIGNWSSIVAGVAGTAGVVAAGVDQAAKMIDERFGFGKDPNVSGATSGADTAKRLREAGELGVRDLATSAALLPEIAGWLGFDNPWSSGTKSRNKRRAAIDELARSNPAQLRSALGSMTGGDLDYAQEALESATAGQAYQKALKGQTTVVNVNTVTAHLNDGESLRAVVQRAQRNNGQTTTRFKQP